MCCLNHRTLYLLMCVLLTCFFLFIGNNSSERTHVFCWEMVLGLARGKSNSGEAEITQETACMRSQRMWPLRLGESGGPNCPTLFCLGLRADEKWVCVNTRPVREGYYSRVWLERMSPRLRPRERGNFFHGERRRILLKDYLGWEDAGYLFIFHCFWFDWKYEEILLIIILVPDPCKEKCRVPHTLFLVTCGKDSKKTRVGGE